MKELKKKVRQSQLKAAVAVNTTLLEFYWELGADIVKKQKNATWGSGFLKRLSHDLMSEFPDMKGFSKRNLEQIRRWYLFYSEAGPIAKQPATQLFSIPWWHNVVIVSKCKTTAKAFFYIQKTIEKNWSRSVLTHQIESGLYEREGKAMTNFSTTLPAPQSDLAQQILKDPYNFDFLTLTEEYNERELEQKSIRDRQTMYKSIRDRQIMYGTPPNSMLRMVHPPKSLSWRQPCPAFPGFLFLKIRRCTMSFPVQPWMDSPSMARTKTSCSN
ncbi:MAG: DUF1016 N-terminal domain-containing protein [Desulfoplanes sp.]|nr:DUF1016 N-terminal domain-containing protein [Desulfoplanes sp.]